MNSNVEGKQKRQSSGFIPFFKKDDKYHFFLQMRDSSTKHSPNRIALFGGGIEGNETPEQALVREIKEELDFDLRTYSFYSRYEFRGFVNNVYYLEVLESFPEEVRVLEGEYGLFLSEEELRGDIRVVETALVTLTQFAEYLRDQEQAGV